MPAVSRSVTSALRRGGDVARQWRDAAPLAALVALLGAVWLVLATANAAVTDNDFYTLFDSANLYRSGASPYELVPGDNGKVGVNLNHPVVVALTLPFTLLPREVALVAWTLVNLAAGVATVRLIGSQLGAAWSARQQVLVAAAAVTSPGVAYCVATGQMGLLLAFGATTLWVAVREQRWFAAGALLGLLVVLKPFFLPLAAIFVLRRRAVGIAGCIAGAAAPSLAMLPVVGVAGFRDWIAALSSIHWFDHPLNVSVAGFAARLSGGGMSRSALLAITLLVVAAVVPILFRGAPPWLRRDDRDVALLLVAAIAASPLGWLYYTPALAPAFGMIAAGWSELSAAGRRCIVAGGVLLWTPYVLPPLAPATGVGAVVASVHTYGLAVAFVVLAGVIRLTSKEPQAGVVPVLAGGTA